MAEYIEREALKRDLIDNRGFYLSIVKAAIENAPTADVVEVVRCQDCAHAEPLDRNCEISTSLYMHCKLWRGDHTRNVWHKYKKYYKDYSLVMRDGYCSDGEKMDGKGDAE